MSLWIHFNLLCDFNKQIQLHKIFRAKISKWYDTKLVTRSVLTYHFNYSRRENDSLYLCLEIPSVRPPNNRGNLVPEETLKQIPMEIKDVIRQTTSEYFTNPDLDKLEVLDYEQEIIHSPNYNSLKNYDNALIEEILRFASKGTDIALELLNSDKTKNRTWKSDKAIVASINEKVQANLISDRERKWGTHFVCNSAFLVRQIETIIRAISTNQIVGNGRGVLEFLYKIERTGNLSEAWQHFLIEYKRYLVS